MKRINFGLVISVLGGVVLFGTTRVEATPAILLTEAPIAALPASAAEAAPVVAPAKAKVEAVQASISLKNTANPVLTETGACAPGMVEVDGDYCPWLEQKCLRWLDPETKMRCAEFAPTSQCQSKTTHKHFCIDRFEYPNKPGEKPVVMKTWNDAKATCEGAGKRLCGETEWTLACEGQEHLPYPYGYARNAEACNIDKPHPDPDEKAIANPATRAAEVARLDQRDPSGAREACVSPYCVNDMTGNVDEWVVNESGHPYKSSLKGGYWGPVRDRCRPSTTAHNEDFIFYQIGFRCCGDTSAPGGAGVKEGPNSGSRQNPLPSIGAKDNTILAGS